MSGNKILKFLRCVAKTEWQKILKFSHCELDMYLFVFTKSGFYSAFSQSIFLLQFIFSGVGQARIVDSSILEPCNLLSSVVDLGIFVESAEVLLAWTCSNNRVLTIYRNG